MSENIAILRKNKTGSEKRHSICPICRMQIPKGNIKDHLIDHQMSLTRKALHHIRKSSRKGDPKAICIERQLCQVMNLVENAA